MLRGWLESIAGRSQHRNLIHQVTFVHPLQRFSDVEGFGYFPLFKSLAKSLAKQTSLIVVSLLSDEAIPQWTNAGESATAQQLSDLGIFCSHCLVQFALKELQARSAGSELPADLQADLCDLVRLMYGDFASRPQLGSITFDESLQSRNLDDDIEIRYLMRFVDQLLAIEDGGDSNRDVKMRKIRELIISHSRAFAYKIHGVL
jgi:hypothetical protein